MHDESKPCSERAKPAPWTKTSAAIDFAERTVPLFEFSEAIENALAEDYFHNPSLYTDEVLKSLGAWHVAVQLCESTVDEVLHVVRYFSSRCSVGEPSA